MGFVLNQNESINAHYCSNDHDKVEQCFSSKNYTKVANLPSNNFIFQGIKPEQTALFDIVQTLCAFMDSLFGKSNKERHHNET